MSEFHYVRTMGVDGGVSAVEGPAVGLDVETILKDGLPPFKVAIEIMSAMCEIIDIADQDGEAHGELIPRYVFLDETGAVSIEGYGNKRTKTSAPERVPKGTVTDQWCLGYVAFRLLSAKDLPAPLPEEAQAYDDAIIDAILGINFEDLPEEIVGDIQWFVAKLMSFEKEDRPSAVDVWRTFIAFADSIPGPRLDDWATAALGGGGDRRDKQKAAARPEAPKPAASAATGEEEDLGGPVMQSGPLAKGGLSFDGGGKKGQATAFWSKEDMKKALEEDDDPASRKPKAGGGSATAFWSRDQMQAMSEGKADAPRPKRKENSTRPATMMMKPPKREDEEPDLDRPGAGKSQPPKKAPPPPPVNQGSQGGAKAPPPQAQPIAQQPMLPPPGAIEAPPEGGGGPPIGLIVGVVLLLLLLLGGGALVLFGGGGALLWANNNAAAEQAAKDAEDERIRLQEEADAKAAKEAREAKKAEAAAKKKAEEEAAAAAGTKPGTKTPPKTTPPKTTPGTTTTPKTTTTPPKTTTTTKVKPKPVEVAPAGPAVLKLRSSGRGKLSCSDGQAPSFDGLATVEFDPYTLPVTCMVTIDGKRGAISVDKSMTQTCNVSGSDVICN